MSPCVTGQPVSCRITRPWRGSSRYALAPEEKLTSEVIGVSDHLSRVSKSLLCLFVFVGCKGGQSELAPVSGTVTVSGRSVANLVVKFVPENASGPKLMGASATTDAEGKYKLISDDGREGAAPGWYKVLVSYSGRSADR